MVLLLSELHPSLAHILNAPCLTSLRSQGKDDGIEDPNKTVIIVPVVSTHVIDAMVGYHIYHLTHILNRSALV